ncbi:MAG: 30S ribosomal protein S27ae [Candidatus Heimdallarchaeota archaeon]|nr:30S ribosomal protein S27ae [Candidatus Heimdallarchaeota archaeon]MBY8993287.1 30S ribosomal protein S27ae [Candidatus Heimdallarchaeota archaeon]
MPKEKNQEVWKYYSVDKSGIKRTKKECPRCKGSFLAEHKDRSSCGHCGYTEFKTKGSR